MNTDIYDTDIFETNAISNYVWEIAFSTFGLGPVSQHTVNVLNGFV